MPAAYVKMRDKFIAEGSSESAAKTKAAKIYNATHETPVTRDYDKKHPAKKKSKPQIMRYARKKG